MKKRYSSLPAGWSRVAFGIGVGMLAILTMTGGFAWLIRAELLDREGGGLYAVAILIAATLLGALSTGRGEGNAMRCAGVGIGLTLALLFLDLLFFDGGLKGLLPGILVIGGTCAAALLLRMGNHRGQRIQYRRPKYRNR